MELYLAAASENKEAERNPNHMKIKAWVETTRETRRAYEEALLALNQHKAEDGC